MLLDTLSDTQTYHKSTLVEVLREVKSEHEKRTGENLSICSSYKTIMRREKLHVQVYTNVVRDPVNGWRMYTGRMIRKIVEWELARKEKS